MYVRVITTKTGIRKHSKNSSPTKFLYSRSRTRLKANAPRHGDINRQGGQRLCTSHDHRPLMVGGPAGIAVSPSILHGGRGVDQ